MATKAHFASLLLLLAGCATHGYQVRSWLDSETAVTVTAQKIPLVLSREEFAAGVNVRDYAELGCFEVNRSGQRKLYIGMVLWSTVNRSAAQLAESDVRFARVTVQADDRPIALQRIAQNRRAIGVSTPVFELPAPGTREAYYELTPEQFAALSSARTLNLLLDTDAADVEMYKLWRGDTKELRNFRTALNAGR